MGPRTTSVWLVTAMEPDLFLCPYLRMQNAANDDFTPEETARMHDYLLKGGFLWIDDNWDPDFDYIRPNLMRILPGAKIVDLPVEHPMFSILYRANPLPQIPSLGSWKRTRQDSEIGPSTVHYYGVFDDHDRLLVLVSMNSDVFDSWEREGRGAVPDDTAEARHLLRQRRAIPASQQRGHRAASFILNRS